MEPEIHSLKELFRYMEEKNIPQDDPRRHVMYARFLQDKARRMGVPKNGIFELTPRCNLDCKMCYVHLDKEQMKGVKELPGDTWLHLIDQAVEAGMMGAEITGGEAMLHRDFDRIYLHLIDKGVNPVVMTNGLLLTAKRIDFFKQHPPGAIQVSLYGGDEDCYERVTGFRKFKEVAENIRAAKEIGCTISLGVTPSKYLGADDVISIIRFAREMELDPRINNDLNQPYEDTGRQLEDFNLELEDYIKIRRARFTLEQVEIKKNTGPLPEEGSSKEEVRGVQCGAGRSVFCINWKGEMKACLDLPFSREPLKEGFLSAWKAINEQANSWPIPAECSGCVYGSICNRCPAIHALGGVPGRADKRICARTKRLVAEGLAWLPGQDRPEPTEAIETTEAAGSGERAAEGAPA